MQKKIFLSCLLVSVITLFNSSAFGQFMGTPVAGLENGTFSGGIELSQSEATVNLEGISVRTWDVESIPDNLYYEVYKEIEADIDLESDTTFAKIGCGINDFLEVYFRLGLSSATKDSDSDDLASHHFSRHIPDDVASDRYHQLMSVQSGISSENNQKYIGKTIKVLVEESLVNHLFAGRTNFQAPEVDGLSYINTQNSPFKLKIGSFVDMRVTDAMEYDLIGAAV